MNKQHRQVCVVDLVISYVSIVSILNVVLLSIGWFYPFVSLSISLLIVIFLMLIFKIKIAKILSGFSWLLIGILAIALLLRFNPNLYLTGGQDEGTYVSLSKQYEINHSLYITDEFRDSLSESLKKLYDVGNVYLGVEMKNDVKSEYVMPFYPVFPSWMSIFSNIFGSDNRVLALTSFGILSVISVYLFSYEISDRNKKIALLSAFLVAINPLHVYFSRFPVTEIVSSTFFFFSLYYLARFYNDYKKGKFNVIYLVISLLTANALFYTRMSSLLLLPVFLLIVVISFLFCKDKKLKKVLTVYSLLWIVFLGISYLYYYIFIPSLFNSILSGRILNYLDWRVVIISVVIFIIGAILLFCIKKVREKLKIVLLFIYKYIYIFLLVVFLVLILYELYFYVEEIFINNHYSLLGQESLSLLKQQSFLATLLYLSPLGFILLPFSFLFLGKQKDVKKILFIALIMILLTYLWGVLRLTPYHYYFVRYQISELVPMLLILLSMFLVRAVKKKFLIILICSLLSIYSLFFSVIQLRDIEGASKETYEELSEIVTNRDILLVVKDGFSSFDQIIFPLKYYYEINVFPVTYLSPFDTGQLREEIEKYDNIYILSAKGNLENKEIHLVKKINFEHNYFVHCNRNEDMYFSMEGHSSDIPFCKYIIIPNRYYYGVYTMYLYKWDSIEIN